MITPYAVGDRYPHALAGEGLQAIIDATDEGLSVMLVAAFAGPTPKDVVALTRKPIRVALLRSGPIAWIVVAGEGIQVDAPYGVGLAGAEHLANLQEAARRGAKEPDARGLLTLAVVDLTLGLVAGLRGFTLSPRWIAALNEVILAGSVLSQERYQALIRMDVARWPSSLSMVREATIVEVAGRV